MLNVKILIALYLVTDTVNNNMYSVTDTVYNTHVLSDWYSVQYALHI